MLARTDISRVGFGVMRGRTVPIPFMLASSVVIHSVERPLAVLISLACRSGRVRIDDRKAGTRYSEAGARCGTRGIEAGGRGKLWGTRGEDGTLREDPRLSIAPESTVLAIGLVTDLRLSTEKLELRLRPSSPAGVLV